VKKFVWGIKVKWGQMGGTPQFAWTPGSVKKDPQGRPKVDP